MKTKKLAYKTAYNAVHGDKDAQLEVLEYYDSYINALASVEEVTPDGHMKRYVNEDLKATIRLKYVEPLPTRPVYEMAQQGVNFNPEWSIRVNVEHILGDYENLERIPSKIRKAKNLPLLLETAVELARRKAVIERGIISAQGYKGQIQYLLPIYLTNMKKATLL